MYIAYIIEGNVWNKMFKEENNWCKAYKHLKV